MTTTLGKIGFAGIGAMGTPMSSNLIKAGHKLVLFDIDRKKAEAVAATPECEIANSLADLGGKSDTVITMLPDGKLVSRVLSPDAFEEDCRRALVVVTTRDAPPACAALTIDRKVSRASGALSLQRAGDGFEVTAARPAGQDRPWARARPEAVEGARTPTTRPTPRDATPRAEDLEPGD